MAAATRVMAVEVVKSGQVLLMVGKHQPLPMWRGDEREGLCASSGSGLRLRKGGAAIH